MKYKLLSTVLGIVCIVLGINIYKMNSTKVEQVQDCGHTKDLETLKFEKEEWTKRENVFLEQNAFLVNENNELKMQLKRKPLIIYRDVQNNPISDDASEHYTGILSRRYQNQ